MTEGAGGESAPADGRTWGRWFGRPGHSLTRRLIWLASAWIVLALVLTGWALTTQYRESALRQLSSALADTIDEVVFATNAGPDGVVVAEIRDAQTDRALSGKYWAVAELDGEGGVRFIAGSPSLAGEQLAVPMDLPEQLRTSRGDMISFSDSGFLRPPLRQPLRVAASLKSLPGRSEPLVFMAALDRTSIENDTRQFATFTWTSLLILGLGLVIAVFLQVQIGLRPLFSLRNEIADVRKGKAARIVRSYPVEIQPLAEQVNRLLDHNQETVERQRTHVGNLAHALKTPLSVMLAEAGSQTGLLPDMVRKQTEVMKAQVDHHLRRARAAARAQLLGERTPIAEVLDELAVMLERVFEEKAVEIDWRAPDELGFRGERQDLQEILGNLMENACKWAKRRVRISAGSTGLGQMVLVVEDDGPGLPADQREAALERGSRMDETTPGSGLGLSIVVELTRAYGGKITLADSDLGGLKVLLELPAAEA
ncbi:MAG: sensor histidine kinase [Alphaproteobacteria bacterium]|nr:sensor histidine kinase [Alphaproteobacteria bacterium]MBU2041611.1 sensor histidine kinase [Alphaproteobacteria bacterium]MBU2124560.1 sensor histidine kinase [Alphaproteobacteria bacterium]MBU2208647.1 sensor histidine kinase [Alphaproteobacteria bacterium]MBU2290049.1 sensor histidine kinase [Alphaproteobacteria bacterium]